jgi:hypothetical protein
VIEEANHMSFLDRHEAYNAAIVAFAAAVQPRARVGEVEAMPGITRPPLTHRANRDPFKFMYLAHGVRVAARGGSDLAFI